MFMETVLTRSAIAVTPPTVQDSRSFLVAEILVPDRSPRNTPSPLSRLQPVIAPTWTTKLMLTLPAAVTVPLRLPDCAQGTRVPPALDHEPENEPPLWEETVHVSLHRFELLP